jgi:hypothetical protein
VRIIEVTPDVWPPPEAWRIDEQPAVTIGVREGDPNHELDAVRGALGLSDGGTVVAEFWGRLRYYDSSGVHVRTLERRGDGPGESRAFSRLDRFRGDSLLLTKGQMFASRGNSRTAFLILASDGTYGRDITVLYPTGGQASDSVAWINTADGGVELNLNDGSFAVMGSTRARLEGPRGAMIYGMSALMRVGADGELVDTIGEFVTSGWWYRPDQTRRKYDFITGDPEGVPARARGNTIYHAEPERFQIDVFEARPLPLATDEPGRSTRLARSIRVVVPPVPLDAEARKDLIADIVNVYSHEDTEAEREEYRARLDSFPSPENQSVVQSLIIDAPGNLWVELWSSPGPRSRYLARADAIDVERGPSRWIVVTSDGRLVGSVMMPENFEVFEIGADYVLGLWRDEFGVEFVRRHRICKQQG